LIWVLLGKLKLFCVFAFVCCWREGRDGLWVGEDEVSYTFSSRTSRACSDDTSTRTRRYSPRYPADGGQSQGFATRVVFFDIPRFGVLTDKHQKKRLFRALTRRLRLSIVLLVLSLSRTRGLWPGEGKRRLLRIRRPREQGQCGNHGSPRGSHSLELL
jgi:hypothetical protein